MIWVFVLLAATAVFSTGFLIGAAWCGVHRVDDREVF